MAQEFPRQGSPDDVVRAELARADRLRRLRESGLRLWRTAPWMAAACALVAAIGRLAGWPALLSVTLLAAALASLGVYAVYARRVRPVTDADAAAIDAHARLGGELRSAHWFADLPAVTAAEAGDDDRNPWIEFHLARAAERLRAIDWSALYPTEPASREKTATALLTVFVLVVALFVPGRSPLSALSPDESTADPARHAAAIPAGLLPPELRKQIEALLATAEGSTGRSLTASEVRDLLKKLDELRAARADAQRGTDPRPGELTKADAKALAERARRDSENASLEPEVRDALTDLSNKLTEDVQSQSAAAKDAREAAGAKDTQQGDTAQSASSSDKQDGSVQSMKEAAASGGVGIVMMAQENGSPSKEAGLGLGGGAGDKGGEGSLADLGAALRKETVEAKTDNPGENVFTGVKRKTEHGDATVAYTHVQPGAAERGHSTAPPTVPDSRKAAVRSYFTRKQ
jgi:hypothetical protein